MATQTLDYVFPFSRFSFETDINFIVLASGRKSAFFKVRYSHDTLRAGD